MTRAPTEMEAQVAAAMIAKSIAVYGVGVAPDIADTLARSAIRAMREPTDEMVEVGFNQRDTMAPQPRDFADGWKAAIDVASPPEVA